MCLSVVTKIRESKLSIKLVFLIILFGTGSWVEINGIWVELPILVARSPQQWSLPSYLTVIIQLANIGPIIYLLANKYITCRSRRIITETPTIYVILLIGVIASFLLTFTWKETSFVNGKPYSTALFVLGFFLATVDCTSSVTFLPFMSYFPKEYMTVFYVGEGMSGFLPSIAALIQGTAKQNYVCKRSVAKFNRTYQRFDNITSNSTAVERNSTRNTELVPVYFQTEPRFSAQAFFLFITMMMSTSLISFILLVRIKNKQYIEKNTSSSNTVDRDALQLEKVSKEGQATKHSEGDVKHDEMHSEGSEKSKILEDKVIYISTKTLLSLLTLNTLINGVSNGVLPALQSYACLPYGNSIYHLTLALSAVANPLCCFFYFFVGIQSSVAICVGVCVYLVSAGYTVGIAATSPCPLLNNSTSGGVLVLIVTVFGVGLVSYLKTAISTVLRRHGYKALLWNGISIQVGSLIGALIIFPMVNVYDMFQQAQACQQC